MQLQESLSTCALNILVAEDSEDDAVLLARAFRKAGAGKPVHVCRDGQELIDYLSGADKFGDRNAYPWPSILLLDLKMPKVNGFEVLEWLKQRGVSDLPAAVLSSSDHPNDMKRAYDLGACLYFVKPNVPDELTAMVKALMEKRDVPAARV
jgi:DNA-binding response OmpR family regulator